jgi:uncharacterized protein (TIGR02302 family)
VAAVGEPKPPATGARLRLAAVALAWERLWPALAPALAVIAVFAVLALFDLPSRLPGWAHLILLFAFAAAFVALLYDGVRGFRLPRLGAARRRIERESGLSHRPLAALDDTIASGGDDAESLALWQAHRARMAQAARGLRVGWPKAGFARRDPWALRALLVLLLVLAAIDAGPDWADRIGHSLTPNLAGGPAGPAASLDIWVTPPDYTGLPPQLLPVGTIKTPVPVPTGSVLLAQVHGEGQVPRLFRPGRETDFDRIDESNFKAQATLAKSGKVAVWQGGSVLGSWTVAIVPDLPPTIAMIGLPRQTEHGALRLEYNAADDYGVESVRASMILVDNPAAPPLVLDLALPGLHLKKAHGGGYSDLTANPWAGLPVKIVLEARDAIGQSGASAPVTFTLPERVFHNPVARAIVEQRKQLTVHPEDRDTVAEVLSDLSLRPARFDDDIVVFMALRTAQARLRINGDPETVPDVQTLLWQAALRIEDGRAPLMQESLRQAMQALQDALARNASNAEINRLTEALRQAMNRYLQALVQNAQRQGMKNLKAADPAQTAMTGRDLQKMLDRAQELARSGARDAARDLLAQLQEMLENLQLGRMNPMQTGAERMLGALQNMMRRQQQLLDQSFRDSRAGKADEQGATQSQEDLRRALGEMMRRLGESGEIPQPLQRAERAMRGAAGALGRGKPGEAIGPQTEALDQLQQGARRLGERMMGRNGDNGQNDYGEPDDDATPRQARRDPFGRSRPHDQGEGWVDDGGPMRRGAGPEVDTALHRAKTILDELRRRAGERSRPEIERDYIDRLLKEF